jgi:hypothetical protein
MAPASYAMFWWIGDGPRSAGRVEVDAESMSLSATTPGSAVTQVGFRELVRVLLERGLLHVERRAEPAVHIGSLDTPGALRELADRLSESVPRG